jgi:hypothetical protein
MRSAILIFLAGLAFATTPACAQSAWLERDMVRAVCSREASPAAGERLAERLNLTDVQKSALRDMTDAFASANASAKKSLCTDKPDLSTTPGRMAFAERMAEVRLAGLKAIEPKLEAFYDTLDARQKRAFDTGGLIGGISTGGVRDKGRDEVESLPVHLASCGI